MSGLGPVPCSSIISLCELYGGTLEDFEKVLLLDDQQSAASEAKKEKKEAKNNGRNLGIEKFIKVQKKKEK